MLFEDEVPDAFYRVDAKLNWFRLDGQRVRGEIDGGNDCPYRIASLRRRLAHLDERVMAPGGPFDLLRTLENIGCVPSK